jgi:hypothetical protein
VRWLGPREERKEEYVEEEERAGKWWEKVSKKSSKKLFGSEFVGHLVSFLKRSSNFYGRPFLCF